MFDNDSIPTGEIYKDVKKRMTKPKLDIVYDKEDDDFLGFYTHYQFNLHRKHARVYVWNRGKSEAKNVRTIMEVETPRNFLQAARLHWAITPYVSPDPETVRIPEDDFRILDIVFSQPEDGTELHEDFISKSIYGPPEEPMYSTPTPATLPPEVVGQLEILERDKDRIREKYAGMYQAKPNGCYRSHNIGLLFPREAGQHYFPPGEYKINITVNGDNCDEVSKFFTLISPDYWRDLELRDE